MGKKREMARARLRLVPAARLARRPISAAGPLPLCACSAPSHSFCDHLSPLQNFRGLQQHTSAPWVECHTLTRPWPSLPLQAPAFGPAPAPDHAGPDPRPLAPEQQPPAASLGPARPDRAPGRSVPPEWPWAFQQPLAAPMRRPAGSKAGRRRAAAGPPPPPQPPALAAPLAAALLALALLLAAQPAGAQQLSELQLADVAQSCPVSLRYAVSLGDGRDAKGPAATVPTVPIFVAVVTLQNHENVRWGAVPAGAGGSVGTRRQCGRQRGRRRVARCPLSRQPRSLARLLAQRRSQALSLCAPRAPRSTQLRSGAWDGPSPTAPQSSSSRRVAVGSGLPGGSGRSQRAAWAVCRGCLAAPAPPAERSPHSGRPLALSATRAGHF